MSLQTSEKPNCVTCILDSRFDPMRFFCPVKTYCPHDRMMKAAKTRCAKSNSLLILGLTVLVLFAFSTYTYSFCISTICQNDAAHCLIFLGDFIFAGSTVALGFVTLSTVRLQVAEFASWARVSEQRRHFGLKTLLNAADYGRLVAAREIMLLLSFCATLTSVVVQLHFSYDGLPWCNCRKISLAACCCLQFYVGVSVVVKLRMIGGILESFRRTLRNVLRSNAYPMFPQSNRQMSLEKILKSYSRLVLTINKNVVLWTKHVAPVLTTYILTIIIALILNIYSIIKVYNYDVSVFVMIEIRTATALLRIVMVFVAAEWYLNNKSEDILSFLFKYPISKLTAPEAAQLEVLIGTLTIQKPVLRVSDIFTIGKRLLASISGTVLTYVLVALQFHVSWAD